LSETLLFGKFEKKIMTNYIKPTNYTEYCVYKREWAYAFNDLSVTLKSLKAYIAECNNTQHALLRHIKLGLNVSELQEQLNLTHLKLHGARKEYLALKFNMRSMFLELKEEQNRKKAEWLTDEQHVERKTIFWKKVSDLQMQLDLNYKGQDGTNFW
jgi:hypothetical protein